MARTESDGGLGPGAWWKPSAPTQFLTGDVALASSGAIELNLLGTFDMAAAVHGEAIPLLHGYDQKDRRVTLTGLRPTGFHTTMPGLSRSRYHVSRMFIGEHIRESEKFDELLIATTFLPDWIGHHSLIPDVHRRFGQRRVGPGVVYRWPPRYHARIGADARVDVVTSVLTQPSRESLALSEKAFLRVRITRPATADALLSRFGRPLLDPICLGTERANAYTRVLVGSRRFANRLGPRRVARKEIEYVAQWITAGVPELPDHLLIPHDQLFTLADGLMAFRDLIPRWLAVHDELAECVTPYFSLIYAPPTFQDTRVVAVTPALEAFHRLRYPDKAPVPEAEWSRFGRRWSS
jgi:hypothetical protein